MTGELADVKAAEALHLKVCARCHRVGVNVYQRCDVGWSLAKRRHRAEYAASKRYELSESTQGELW